MSKVIAVDIDEVLADFVSYFVYFHNLMYKTNASKGDFKNYYLHEAFGVDREEMTIRYLEFKALHLLERIEPVKGAKIGIKGLIAKGYEPHLVTARPQVLEKETKKWLEIHFKGFSLPVHFTHYQPGKTPQKKSAICKKIGAKILIDDHIDNALDCVSEDIKVYLIDSPWNKQEDLPPGIIRVKSWKEILKLI